jgi:Tol biopolymer transport system component
MVRRIALFSRTLLMLALASCVEDEITTPRIQSRPPALRTTISAAAGNGLIAFTSYRDGNAEIYTMDPDGSNHIRLTNNAANDIYPTWSPNGSRIAFVSDRDGNLEIYVMNADGSSPTRLTTNSVLDAGPTWSPDGSKIAFVTERDGGSRQIYVMNADGSSPINLSNKVGLRSDEQPHWSPNGTKIAFSRSGGTDGNGEVYVMNADGSGQTNLTIRTGVDSPLDWSPDGSKLVIASNRDQVTYELYVMNADVSAALTRLTNNTVPEYPASWSPDGAKIAFNQGGQIYVMDADGSNPVNLSNNLFTDQFPDWAPLPPGPPDGDSDAIPDVADNCPTTSNPVQADTDRDGFGDACDGDDDNDGISDPVDTAPTVVSFEFSDVPLGGKTPGAIVSVPANTSVTIDDAAGPDGVRVTVTATGPTDPNDRVHITLTGKAAQEKLAVPGVYVITDPVTSTILAVEADGPGEVELTLNGNPITVSIAEGASATVNETTNSSGALTDVTVSDVTGNSGDVTVNDAPVEPGSPPVSPSVMNAKLTVNRGKLALTGTFTPAGTAPVNPGVSDVTFKAGAYSFFMASGLLKKNSGAYVFSGTLASAPGVQFTLELKPPKAGKVWAVKATASPVSGFVNPVEVSLQIGSVAGGTEVTATLR